MTSGRIRKTRSQQSSSIICSSPVITLRRNGFFGTRRPRLRDRFFGSRVGRRALMAVALTFGRRGMALLEFQLRMRRLVGERVRSAAGSSEGLSNELYERVQRPSATA